MGFIAGKLARLGMGKGPAVAAGAHPMLEK
jgi:hypothetical protein